MPTNKAKKDSKVLNSKPETRLTVENFSKMTLEERLVYIDCLFSRLEKAVAGRQLKNPVVLSF